MPKAIGYRDGGTGSFGFKFTDDGQITLGNTSDDLIQVTGTLDVEGSLTVDTSTLYVDSSASDVRIGSAAALTNVAPRLLVKQTSTGQNTGILLARGDSAGNEYLSLDINTTDLAMITAGAYGDGDCALAFRTSDSSETERMRITHDGKVGINTTSPSADLHVKGTNSGGGVTCRVENTSNSANAYSEIYLKSNTMDTRLRNYEDSTSGGGRFEINLGGDADPIKMRIVSKDLGENWDDSAIVGDDTLLGVVGEDAVFDLVSEDNGTYSSIIGLKEVSSDLSTYADGWGIVKQTKTTGESKLKFTYGTDVTLYDNTAVMTFTTGSQVGIGTTSPETMLHIKQTTDGGTNDPGNALRLEEAGGAAWWNIGLDNDSSANKPELAFRFADSGGEESGGGYMHGSNDQAAFTFTGQHMSSPLSGDVTTFSNKVGMIVVSSGEYKNLSVSEEGKATINESLPKISLSTQRNQKSAFGVVSKPEDPNEENRRYQVGAFGTQVKKKDSRVVVNSLGEGGIWITNINGNIENGDYITTCEIPGYGMKQDDDLLHNYTVAKITQDCLFDLNSTTYECEEIQHDNTTYRAAFVGCTYHCG